MIMCDVNVMKDFFIISSGCDSGEFEGILDKYTAIIFTSIVLAPEVYTLEFLTAADLTQTAYSSSL